MTVIVTMRQTRMGEDGTLWAVNTSHSSSDEFAQFLIGSNLATGALPQPAPSALTSAETLAVRSVLSGPQQRVPAPSAIAFQPGIKACWWKMDEGSGTTIVDEVQGLVATVAGTTSNLWDNADAATLNSDTVFGLRNNAVLDEIMRLDTLDGSLIVGVEIQGVLPSGTGYAWGYGDVGSAVDGAYGCIPNTAGGISFPYSIKAGATSQTESLNPTANESATPGAGLITKNRKFWHLVIHHLDSRLYLDGYEAAHHSRSTRVHEIEAGLPSASSSRGLRIGARPLNTSGAAITYYGGVVSLPQISNWHAIRISGDHRSEIPGWINNICATMPYGAIPRVLNNG